MKYLSPSPSFSDLVIEIRLKYLEFLFHGKFDLTKIKYLMFEDILNFESLVSLKHMLKKFVRFVLSEWPEKLKYCTFEMIDLLFTRKVFHCCRSYTSLLETNSNLGEDNV
jgi:hypothetical protein